MHEAEADPRRLASEAPARQGPARPAARKGHRDENFPVASRLVRPALRPPILAFYRFARSADDVADQPGVSPEAKLARLAQMEAALLGQGGGSPEASALRSVLAGHGLSPHPALDLLEAFRRDATVARYPDWEALMDYCRFSAAPVGRFVLELHGESAALWPASDALCAALQVINHMQDCGKDWHGLGRAYVPLDILAAHGAGVETLDADHASPALRAALEDVGGRTMLLLERSRPLPAAIQDRRLALEVGVIQALAESLLRRLRRRDPLSERVHHHPAEAALVALGGGFRTAFARLLGRERRA